MISRLPRRALRAGFVSAIVASATMVTSPAFAEVHQDDGDDPGNSISRLKMVLVLGGIPIGLFLLIALVVSLPSIMKGPRYRPGKGWQGTPEWYGAPEADKPAVAGSGSQAALTGPIVTGDEADAADAADGGTSARW